MVARIAAGVVAVLGFLPLTNWISGGHAAPWFSALTAEWLQGALIVVGGAIVLSIIARRVAIIRPGAFDDIAGRAARRPLLTGACISVCAAAAYAAVAYFVFSARPLLIDELSQLIQAQIFADGRLWRDAPTAPEFTSILHILDSDGKWYSQFPPGGPLFLLPGIWIGVPWLSVPIAGGASVAVFWGIVRRIEERPAVALGATLLLAFAPFVVFMSGSHMNHTPTLLIVLVAMWALVRQMGAPVPAPRFAALAGFALGAAASIRPVDAVAFALPAGVWMLVRAARVRGAWREVVAAGVALAVPLLLLLWYNAQTTGNPFLFAYELLWGRDHALGFHQAPWGFAHTPARGLELLNLYFLRLQSFLFESPIPSLLPAVVALALTRRLDGFDRYLLATAALLLGLYFAYWHDGFYLGPRFVYLLVPLLVLWTSRLPSLLRAAAPRAEWMHRGVWSLLVVSAIFALTVNAPLRARMHSASLMPMRQDYTAPARERGVDGALILVRESWGSQLVARMWARGISRSETERFYRQVDACALDEAVFDLERRDVRGQAAVAALIPLLADSARVVRSDRSPDDSERMLPGRPYGPVCERRLADDRAGFTLLAPLHAQDWGSNRYARDLHARNSALLAEFGNRPWYLLRPTSAEAGAPLRLFEINRDSLVRAWSAESALRESPSSLR